MLEHVIRALGRVSDQIVANLPTIVEASPTLPFDVILARLINGIAAWKRDLVLVIDDAHFLTNPDVGAILDGLLSYARPNLRVLLATRGAVPMKVATLRMRGLMVRLDETALRFSLDEAVSFLNDCRGLSLAKADVLALQNRTEGWIAALQLASLALTEVGSGSRERFLHQFSVASGDIADFLMQDVIGRLPPGILDFLLRTSVLEWFDADLAEALSGQPDAGARLKEIAGANLFLVPLDPERTLYRYHHLFADLLRTLLRQCHAGDLALLHRTAARRLAERALPADAVHHALAAGDTEEAAALVEACCMPLIRQSHPSRVREWLTRLPDAVIGNRPRLLLAEARWSSIPDDLPFLRGTLGNILAYSQYSLGNYAKAQQACLIARDSNAKALSVFGG